MTKHRRTGYVVADMLRKEVDLNVGGEKVVHELQ